MPAFKALSVVCFVVLAAIATAAAQGWPTRQITMVVAFPAGGSDDALAHILAPRLSELLGQPVVIENIDGRGGITGASRIANASADGYQFILGSSATHALSQALHKTPPYDASTDFTPVALIAEQPFVLIARKDTPTRNLREFIAYAKANRPNVQYGSAGIGSATHLVCAVLNASIGIEARHVPYNGGAPAMRDLVAGRIDYFCPVITIAIPEIEKRSVNAVAVLSKDRAPVLADLRSAREQGLTNFTANTWFAAFLPKGAPTPIVRRLHDAIVATMETPSVQNQLKSISADLAAPERRSPEYLSGFLQQEIAKWRAAIAAAGIMPD